MSQTPGAPTALNAAAGNTTISITFTAPSSIGSSAITNYMYSTDGGTTYTTRSPVSIVSPILITSLTNGTSYSIRIKAVNTAGPGTASDSVSATPTAAAAKNPVSGASTTDGLIFAGAAIVAGSIAINALTTGAAPDNGGDNTLQIVVSRTVDFALVAAAIYAAYNYYGSANNADLSASVATVQTKLDNWFTDPTSMLVYLTLAAIAANVASFIISATLGSEAKPGMLSIAEPAIFLALLITLGIWVFKFVLNGSVPSSINVGDKLKTEVGSVLDTNGKEVFNVSTNIYTYDEAQAICEAYDAELATYKQVEAAYNRGGEWCNYGWSAGQMALFPTQHSTWDALNATELYKNACGRPGVNGGYIANPKVRFGVNCYGKKPKQTDTDKARMKANKFPPHSGGVEGTTQDFITDAKVSFWKKHADTFLRLNPFNRTEWSE